MSELNTPLPTFPAPGAVAALLGALSVFLVLFSSPAGADEFAPLNSRPATLAELDVSRHVPGVSRDETISAEGVAEEADDGLYRQVNRNFKFGLRYARAVFALAPAEAPEDDHYVFLNLVGML